MTGLDATAFEYYKATPEQITQMGFCRNAAADYEAVLDMHVPDGPDKDYLLRKLREVAMWANVAITRHPDGSLRVEP